jgi:DNA-binding NarL/FixJ family response regulator
MEAALLLKELYDKLTTEEQTLLELVFEQYSGAETAARLAIEPTSARKRVSRLMEKLAQLSTKVSEIPKEAELAYKRITKDQEEIENLKQETRALLAQLSAA